MPTTHATKTLIIGAGPAGYTAAVYAARAGLDPVVIQGLQPGGQLTITTDVENWPGEISILGPDLTDRMARQAEHAGARLVFDLVTDIDVSRRPFTVSTDSGDTYICDSVIIATGAQAKWLGLPSERAFMGQGVSGCAVCDGAFFRNKEVIVVGGGNTAVEDALYLTHHASRVTVVHRRDGFRAEKILQKRLFAHPKIEVVWNHAVEDILGEGTPARVTGVKLRDTVTGENVRSAHRRGFRGHRAFARDRGLRRQGAHGCGRVHPDAPRFDRDRHTGIVRGGRRQGPDLPPSRHGGRHGLHGGTRGREVPRGTWAGPEVRAVEQREPQMIGAWE